MTLGGLGSVTEKGQRIEFSRHFFWLSQADMQRPAEHGGLRG